MLAVAIAAALASAGVRAAEPERFSEYQVKAGFLYNFAKLIEWPADTPPTLSLCIVGDEPFGPAREAMDGKAVGDKSLAVRAAASAADLRGCQIVFIAASETGRLPALLQDLRERPVLTGADGAGQAARGAVAGFYRDGDKVRFEINVDAARRARLSISSRLLNLARIVHDEQATR